MVLKPHRWYRLEQQQDTLAPCTTYVRLQLFAVLRGQSEGAAKATAAAVHNVDAVAVLSHFPSHKQ